MPQAPGFRAHPGPEPRQEPGSGSTLDLGFLSVRGGPASRGRERGSRPSRTRRSLHPTGVGPGWTPDRDGRTSRESGPRSRLQRSVRPPQTPGSHTPTVAEPGRRTNLTRVGTLAPSRALGPAGLNSEMPTPNRGRAGLGARQGTRRGPLPYPPSSSPGPCRPGFPY